MNIGMLWYDPDPKRLLAEKVQAAADYYRAKYGRQPTECHLHPTLLAAGAPTAVGAVRLRPNRTIIKNHFWLGIGEPEPHEVPA